MSIVILDDTLEHRELLAELIAEVRPTVEVICLERSAQLLPCLEQHAVDLLLIDLLMPSTNGLELSRELRRRDEWKNLPIVVVSGWQGAFPGNDEEEDGDVFDAFLTKPFVWEELESLLDRYIPLPHLACPAS